MGAGGWGDAARRALSLATTATALTRASATGRAAIVAGVAPQAAQLSLNKFASFFVDTLLEAGALEEREAVAR